MDPDDALFWRRKLSAYMHDPPEKALRIYDHEVRAAQHRAADQIEDYETFKKTCDHLASAADRLPWPVAKACRDDFDGVQNAFRHPLGGAQLTFEKPFESVELAEEGGQVTRPKINEEDPRAEFFARWRMWRWWAASRDPRLAFLPAETRLPDHTIWTHMAVTSALQACEVDGEVNPAYLLFSIGPVQDFIAAARSTRDLWSGSYLLSYLAGTAMAEVALNIGPDNIIFPNLCGQPLFDLLVRAAVWDRASTSDVNLWETFGYDSPSGRARLLTPGLPNRFLALVPAPAARQIAERARDAVNAKLTKIGDGLHDAVERRGLGAGIAWERFDQQLSKLLEISWQTLPWPGTVAACEALAGRLAPADGEDATPGLATARQMVAATPDGDRDKRYFTEGELNNVGASHGDLYATTNRLLAAVKQTRAFPAWDDANASWVRGRSSNKDQLNGKEEVVLDASGRDASAWDKAFAYRLVQPNERIGASTLVKRLWHLAYLQPKYDFSREDFGMPNTHSIALSEPFSNNAEEDIGNPGEAYFAVIALDGDEMGKWLSGEKNPPLGDQFGPGAKAYFEGRGSGVVDAKRPLSPSFHLQFSEMLSTFAQTCARRVVEAFDGRLIYAGGDDVLAMVPAARALPCARALRAAFRGEPDRLNALTGHRDPDLGGEAVTPFRLFDCTGDGFVRLHTEAPATEEEPKSFSALVPGRAADVSAGVAIAHAKHPLQSVVRAAQAAEKEAKSDHGRGAVAVSLFKRSGEIVKWGAKWESGGLELAGGVADAINGDEPWLNARFPYRVIALLEPFLAGAQTGSSRADETDPLFAERVDELITIEVRHALDRHLVSAKFTQRASDFAEGLGLYLQSLAAAGADAQGRVRAVIGLMQTAAWVRRRRGRAGNASKGGELR